MQSLCACTEGREFDCPEDKFGDSKQDHFGVHTAEQIHLPEVNVSKIPEGVSYEEAAAASMTILTSWHMLVGRAKITPGQTVLVMGGGSGVGALQFKLQNYTTVCYCNCKSRQIR